MTAEQVLKLLPISRHALRTLAQHRLRSALSTLGIACGVTSFLLMMSIGEGARRETLAQIEKLGMRNIVVRAATLTPQQVAAAQRKGSQGLLASDEERIRAAVTGISEVALLRERHAPVYAAARELSPSVLEVSPSLQQVQGLSLASGRFIGQSDLSNQAQVCVLGPALARNLGLFLGSTLRIENLLYRVVGILSASASPSKGRGTAVARDYDSTVFLPLSKEGPLSELVLSVDEGFGVIPAARMARRVLEVVHRGADDYQVLVPQELLRQAEKARSTFDILLGSIGIISLLIGGIGIMNVMLANVAERTHEIGLRRAVGATREGILAQFLLEATILTLLGAALGVVFGLAGLCAASLLADWAFGLTPGILVLPIVISALLGVGFGIYPALQASRLDPIEALRF